LILAAHLLDQNQKHFFCELIGSPRGGKCSAADFDEVVDVKCLVYFGVQLPFSTTELKEPAPPTRRKVYFGLWFSAFFHSESSNQFGAQTCLVRP
jgi:hypothetical protein